MERNGGRILRVMIKIGLRQLELVEDVFLEYGLNGFALDILDDLAKQPIVGVGILGFFLLPRFEFRRFPFGLGQDMVQAPSLILPGDQIREDGPEK